MSSRYQFTEELLTRVATRVVTALREANAAPFEFSWGTGDAFGLTTVKYVEVRPGGLRFYFESDAIVRLTFAPQGAGWEITEEWWPSKKAEDDLTAASIALLRGEFTEREGTVTVTGVRRPFSAWTT